MDFESNRIEVNKPEPNYMCDTQFKWRDVSQSADDRVFGSANKWLLIRCCVKYIVKPGWVDGYIFLLMKLLIHSSFSPHHLAGFEGHRMVSPECLCPHLIPQHHPKPTFELSTGKSKRLLIVLNKDTNSRRQWQL